MLTPREKQVLVLIIEEYTSAQIAEKLYLSIRTVESHRKSIWHKTSSQTFIGLIKYAIREGMVDGYYYHGKEKRRPAT